MRRFLPLLILLIPLAAKAQTCPAGYQTWLYTVDVNNVQHIQACLNPLTGQVIWLSFAPGSITQYVPVSTFSGADWCAKTNAAVASLAGAYGEVWMDQSSGIAACTTGNIVLPAGTVLRFLQPGTYNLGNFNIQSKTGTGTFSGSYNSVQGSDKGPTILNYAGTGDAIRIYNDSFNHANKPRGGSIRNLTVNCTGTGNGIHVGDLLGFVIDNVTVENCTGPGFWFDNTNGWSEEFRVKAFALDNGPPNYKFSVTGSSYNSFKDFDGNLYSALTNSQITGAHLSIEDNASVYDSRIRLNTNGSAVRGSSALIECKSTAGQGGTTWDVRGEGGLGPWIEYASTCGGMGNTWDVDPFSYVLPYTQTACATSTTYANGAMCLDSNGNVEYALTGGMSGGSGPTWPTTLDATVADGNVTWKMVGLPLSAPGSGTIIDAGRLGATGPFNDPNSKYRGAWLGLRTFGDQFNGIYCDTAQLADEQCDIFYDPLGNYNPAGNATIFQIGPDAYTPSNFSAVRNGDTIIRSGRGNASVQIEASGTGAIKVTSPIVSSVAPGTAPLTVGSATPVPSLVTSFMFYNHSGTQSYPTKIISDTCTLGTDCVVTLAGEAVFNANTDYDVQARDATDATKHVTIVKDSGTQITFTGNGTDVIAYLVVGHGISSGGSGVLGPTLPGTGADASGVGSIVWANPGNITADDGSFASATLTAIAGTSHYLRSGTYGFSVPGGATVDGITLQIKKKGASSSTVCRDYRVSLDKAGTEVGNDKADPGYWNNTLQWYTYGGPTDLWGTTWSAAEVNAAGFGASLAVTDDGYFPPNVCDVDAMKITVYYH